MPKVLQPLQRITNGDMSGNLNSDVVDGRYFDQIKWHLLWSGVPVGTFDIQESLNYSPVTKLGTWLNLGLGIADAAGSADTRSINMSDRAPAFYRLAYTFGSGSGTLNVFASGSGP